MSTHYDVLELGQSASGADIKKAYYRMARQYHPDKSSMPNSRAMFQKITDAYKILSSEEDREIYDMTLALSRPMSEIDIEGRLDTELEEMLDTMVNIALNELDAEIDEETLEKIEELKAYRPVATQLNLNKYLKIHIRDDEPAKTRRIRYKKRTYQRLASGTSARDTSARDTSTRGTSARDTTEHVVISTELETLEIPLYMGNLNIKNKGHILQLSEAEKREMKTADDTICGNLIITIV